MQVILSEYANYKKYFKNKKSTENASNVSITLNSVN